MIHRSFHQKTGQTQRHITGVFELEKASGKRGRMSELGKRRKNRRMSRPLPKCDARAVYKWALYVGGNEERFKCPAILRARPWPELNHRERKNHYRYGEMDNIRKAPGEVTRLHGTRAPACSRERARTAKVNYGGLSGLGGENIKEKEKED